MELSPVSSTCYPVGIIAITDLTTIHSIWCGVPYSHSLCQLLCRNELMRTNLWFLTPSHFSTSIKRRRTLLWIIPPLLASDVLSCLISCYHCWSAEQCYLSSPMIIANTGYHWNAHCASQTSLLAKPKWSTRLYHSVTIAWPTPLLSKPLDNRQIMIRCGLQLIHFPTPLQLYLCCIFSPFSVITLRYVGLSMYDY